MKGNNMLIGGLIGVIGLMISTGVYYLIDERVGTDMIVVSTAALFIYALVQTIIAIKNEL